MGNKILFDLRLNVTNINSLININNISYKIHLTVIFFVVADCINNISLSGSGRNIFELTFLKI